MSLEFRARARLFRSIFQPLQNLETKCPFLESPENCTCPKSHSQNSHPLFLQSRSFSNIVKGVKLKITTDFRASRHLRFEDKKRIMSTEKFRDFGETRPCSERFFSHYLRFFLSAKNSNWFHLTVFLHPITVWEKDARAPACASNFARAFTSPLLLSPAKTRDSRPVSR